MDRLNGRHLYQPHQFDTDLVLECLSIFITPKGLLASHKPVYQALDSEDRRLHHINLAFDVLVSQGLTKTLNICTSRLEVFQALQAPFVLQMSDLASSCHKLLIGQSFGSEMAHTEGRGNASSNQTYPEIKMKEIETMYAQQGTLSLLIEDSGVSRSTHLSVSQTHLSSVQTHQPIPQAKHFFKKEDSGGGVAIGGGRGLCAMEGGAGEVGSLDGSVSFNREQIIVEVNLNNQTLNVSKGSDGKGITSSTSALHVSNMEEGKEDDDVDVGQDEGEYEHEKEESNEDDDEDEEENNLSIPEVGHASTERPRRVQTGIKAAVTMRQMLIGTALAERAEGRRRREQESLGQKVKLEEKQHFSCKKCPRVFNNRWYLEKHMNVTHNRMQICNKCGKRFLLESELLLHHQTNCEKSIQVHTTVCMHMNPFIRFKFFIFYLSGHLKK